MAFIDIPKIRSLGRIGGLAKAYEAREAAQAR